LSNPSSDFLTEQVDYGSGTGTPTGLVTVFNSAKLLGFGEFENLSNNTLVPGEYWFAFQEVSSPGAGSLASSNEIIGGIMLANSDIKTFAVSAPTPSAAIGGAILMLGLAGWRITKRVALAVA
jgi:hypothetical protein